MNVLDAKCTFMLPLKPAQRRRTDRPDLKGAESESKQVGGSKMSRTSAIERSDFAISMRRAFGVAVGGRACISRAALFSRVYQ